jgi:hypothetical protein
MDTSLVAAATEPVDLNVLRRVAAELWDEGWYTWANRISQACDEIDELRQVLGSLGK